MATMKMTMDDVEPPQWDTWHENFDALHWFRSNMTQFHYNGFGATGFNYAIAYRDFDDMGITGDRLDEWKWKLKVMEAEALYHLNRKAA